MGNRIGSKGGKRDLKLTFHNRKKQKRKEIQELKQQKEKQEQEKKKKQIVFINKKKDTNILEKRIDSNLEKFVQQSTPQTEVLKKRELNQINDNNDIKRISNTSIEIKSTKEESKKTYQNKKTETKMPELTPITKKKNGKNPKLQEKEELEKLEQEKKESLNFIETQIIKIIEQDIEEKKFELKKIDSEIYAMQKNIESTTDEQELLELQKEMQILLEKIERIRSQIFSLENTFDLKFPVEEPDNYLIYLVEKYKNNRKEKIDLGEELRKDPEFKSIVDTLIEIEEAKDRMQQKLQEKKENMQLDEEQMKKLQDDMIDIEEIDEKVTKMLEQSEILLGEIANKVNKTVQITEQVNYITKSVNHSLLSLLLLMNIFKKNLSIKNSAIATSTAAIAFDLILKMTTPIQEKKMIKSANITDYKDMINHCISDSNFLETTINQNLNEISSLRYIFEHDYQSYSYLPAYQEALEKLSLLEENMKEHKDNVIRMKKEMEYHLEKNNEKVKKYDSMST